MYSPTKENDMPTELSEALVNFKFDVVLGTVNERLATGGDPLLLLQELQEGMKLVGDRFSTGDFFLSELMMSADLFTQAMAIIMPKLEGLSQKIIGKMVIGTPKGDIHNIGKDIFIAVAKGAGFEVHDLGVDVPVERFLGAVEAVKPDILGFSALITTAFEPMKVVVEQLTARGLRQTLKVIVGGGVTTDIVREYVGADAQVTDAVKGLEFCKRVVGC
jgi:methanogenic corrinoid protein MtbC1